jgi:serine/threonine protein kinase
MVEQNWSGRGQHARFEEDEQRLINEILEPVDHLGSTNSAVVQSVRCRRILLARKTIKCGKRTMTREEAISEVAHLDRLNHAHILRVIGTYVKGKNLSILLYPVAEYNLETFFEEYLDLSHSPTKERMRGSGLGFYSCLSSAVHYIHLKLTKHMDIKPQNILVRFTQGWIYTLFIADFGISRSYERLEDVETDGWTLFTRPYAAPEVARQDFRGLSADIFSLGCVFLEIFDTFESADLPSNSIKTKLKSNKLGDTPYQANLGVLRRHMADYDLCDRQQASKVNMISRMLSLHAADRPTAEELVNHLGERDCCKTGSVQLEAIRDDR